MFFNTLRLLALFGLTALSSSSYAVSAKLAGRVVSADDTPVSGALVIVQRAVSGMPLVYTSKGHRNPSAGSMLGAVSRLSDAEGKFEFEVTQWDEYHVLAQRWPNPEKPWTTTIVFDDATYYGRQVEVLGTAKSVKASSPEASNLKLSPPGTGSANVTFDAPNDDALLVLSKAPLAVDPVFRMAGWSGDFLTSAVAFNRPVRGQSEFTGLPAGKLYAGIFGNDNNPGYGMAELVVTDGGTTSVEVEWVAKWSNARKTPPPHLMPLNDKLKNSSWPKKNPQHIDDIKAIGQAQHNPAEMQQLLLAARDKEVELSDGTTATLLDVLTVDAYLRLNK